jgi:hypothetical protein
LVKSIGGDENEVDFAWRVQKTTADELGIAATKYTYRVPEYSPMRIDIVTEILTSGWLDRR